MKNVFNKTNAPYLAVGALATLALVSSGVFAVAPYIGFLAPVAALSVGLPFIIGCAVFSAVAIALSAVAISKNNTISGKDAVVQAQKQTISESEAKIQAQEQTISGQNDQLTKKEAEVKAKEEEISKQKIEINKKNEEINNQKEEIEKFQHKKTFVPQAIKNLKEASQKAFAYVAEAYSSGRVHSTIKQRRSDVANDLKNVVGSAKNAYGTSVEFAKDIKTASQKAFASVNEAYSSGRVPGIVKRGLTDVYYPQIESIKGTLSGIGNKLKNVCGTSVGYTMGTLELAKKTLGSIGGSTKEDVATENLSGSKDDNSALSCKDPKISSPANEPAKLVAATVTAGIGLCGAALCYAAPYIPTLLSEAVASFAGSECGYTNSTMYPFSQWRQLKEKYR